MNKNYEAAGLYEHNIVSYEKVKAAFEKGEKVVGIVHATGTGKSFNALQLAYDNPNKNIVYVVPSKSIIEHIQKLIEDNPNFDLKRDFPNLEFRTYHSFISLSKKEIKDIECDLLILDEFHHIGAPIWGARINTMIETHEDMRVFGMTAYTVRDRGTSYERDMAEPGGKELFSNKIVSCYDLCEAMLDGVLPKPIYKSAYIHLLEIEKILEKRVEKYNSQSIEYKECMLLLTDLKKQIHKAPSIPKLLRKNLKPNGKYIYFCPPKAEKGTNDIEEIKKQLLEDLKGFVDEKDIEFYTSTSDMGEQGRKNREVFYNDTTLDGKSATNKLRIMFAINQYNEGVHAPNIDGVILGRGTKSDIIFFEELGRALAVRGNTKEQYEELEKDTIEKLKEKCRKRNIPYKGDSIKEELIEKLIAPIVIDLAGNYDFIKELENNLKNRLKSRTNGSLQKELRTKLREATFDIEILNRDIYEMLRYITARLTKNWEDYYELAQEYYRHHGDLEVPRSFKTNDGFTYDPNGIVNLGNWISNQRRLCNPESERGQLLLKIDMRFDIKKKNNDDFVLKFERKKRHR